MSVNVFQGFRSCEPPHNDVRAGARLSHDRSQHCDQRAALVMEWAEYERGQAKKRIEVARHRLAPLNSAGPSGDTRDLLALRAAVSRNKVDQARVLEKHDAKHGTDRLNVKKRARVMRPL